MSKPIKPARYMRNTRKRLLAEAQGPIPEEQTFAEKVTEIANNIIAAQEVSNDVR